MHENSWPGNGPIHTSTYPILKGGSLTHPENTVSEGGPGSGPQGSGGGKPNVIAHYTYSGPRYTSGLKIPKEEPRAAASHSTSQSPANDVKAKNDAELKRRQASMYQSEASPHSPKWQDCVHDVQGKGSADNAYAVCTHSMGHQSECMAGGVLSPKGKKEADSGSSFPQALRSK